MPPPEASYRQQVKGLGAVGLECDLGSDSVALAVETEGLSSTLSCFYGNT